MAPSTIDNDAIQGEVFHPGQIFIFGGFVLWANSLGHLEQIDSYAPGHHVRFGSLNYVADIRGDLIFNGFETAAIAPLCPDEHDINLSSDHTQEMVPAAATTLEPKQIGPSEAAESAALEPHMDSTPCNIRFNGTSDLSPAISSGLCTPADTELDWLLIFEFSAADVFQHSPLGDVLKSLNNLSLEDSQPNYVWFELETDDEEFCFHPPPTS